MKRKNFFKTITLGTLGATAMTSYKADADEIITAKPKKKVLMKVGCQSGGTSIENLEFKARHGVFHIDGGSPKMIEGKGWDLADSLAKREACEKYGITLEAYHLPMGSMGIERQEFPNMMLGKSPERDREIEIIQNCIKVAGQTGVKLLTYNATILPVIRTGRVVDPARGNAIYTTFNYEDAVAKKLNEVTTSAGVVGTDELYERITYYLDRLLPVAEEFNVKLGNYIADPPLPAGYQGITRWDSPDVFEGIKRYARLYDSKSHGFLLCLGSVAEGLKDPGTEIMPVIKWLGERKQIFNIHLRNIKGGWLNFQEVYPDNGDMNFLEVIRLLRDLEYDGMVCPDHVPVHPAEGSRDQAFAFCYGYIKGLLQAVASEA